MDGNQQVIDQLNKAAASELAAIMAYSAHHVIQDNWHLGKLSAATMQRSITEMHHFEDLMARIVFLNATPPEYKPDAFRIGKTPLEQVTIELDMELAGVKAYNEAIKVCAEVGDNGSRALFEQLVKDEEEHVDYLEGLIAQCRLMGESDWIATLA